jgi:hypothetical protein
LVLRGNNNYKVGEGRLLAERCRMAKLTTLAENPLLDVNNLQDSEEDKDKTMAFPGCNNGIDIGGGVSTLSTSSSSPCHGVQTASW